MRGRMDLASPEAITDYKSVSPYWHIKYGPKGSGVKPTVGIWVPDDEPEKAQVQVSIYNLLLPEGQRRGRGVMWRVYRGVKSNVPAWRRYEFPLLTEAQLEAKCGPWVRQLAEWLGQANELYGRGEDTTRIVDSIPAEGMKMQRRDGSRWNCETCALRERCEKLTGWENF